MKKLFFLLSLVAFSTQAQQLDPKNTYVFITGVLKWQDSKSLSPFSDVHRKDVELKDQFISMGIPSANVVTLIDEKATLTNMKKSFEDISKKCSSKSTFIFYYAGHGIKKEKEFYFANYDIQVNQCRKTGFGLSYLSEDLLTINKSGTIMFWADCCYSGALLEQGQKVKAAGRNALVFSSATASNTSTGNWTFTQTILDCLRGEALNDVGQDGKITATDLSNSLAEAMKYREHQLGGYYSSFTSPYLFTTITPAKKESVVARTDFRVGAYAYGLHEGKWKPVRIIANNGKTFTARFYFYSDYLDEELTSDKLKKVYFTPHSQNAKVKVKWEGEKYEATIVKAENDFYYIKYDGYDDSWNEWVMYDRISSGNEKPAKIEERGSWYPGEIMEQKEGKYFIRYEGYDFSWDEWVTKDRIKMN